MDSLKIIGVAVALASLVVIGAGHPTGSAGLLKMATKLEHDVQVIHRSTSPTSRHENMAVAHSDTRARTQQRTRAQPRPRVAVPFCRLHFGALLLRLL